MFTMEFKTDNVVFCDEFTGEESKAVKLAESAKILGDISREMAVYGQTSGTIKDINGHTIGKWKFE